MSKSKERFANRAIYQLIVDSFENDGVICNFRNKTYDESATYNGGAGYRKIFKQINDEIILYHRLLESLTGEKRANVYEYIPVIDFLNCENTSLLSTYEETPKSVEPVDNTTIRNLDEETEESLTLNRAVMGFDTAEHFYNTTGQASSCQNIQVSYNTGSFAYIYKGQTVRNFVANITDTTLSTSEITLDSKITIYKCLDSTAVNFNFYDLNSSYFEKFEGITNVTSISGSDLSEYLYPTIKIYPDGSEGPSIVKLNLTTNDILVSIPRVEHVSTMNRLLVFKANSVEEGSVQTYKAYLIYITDEGYEPSDTFAAETYNVDTGSPVPSFVTTEEVVLTLRKLLSIEKEYYSEASGLLNGLYSEPYEWNDLGETRTVTKWKLCNDCEQADFDGNSVSIGTKYNNSGLVYTSSILTSPLQLTASDSDESYNGKATLFYDKLLANNSESFIDKLFNNSSLSNWYDYNKSPVSIDNITTAYDYDKTKSKSLAENTYGTSIVNASSTMNYPNKFVSSITSSDIDEYLKSYNSCFDRDSNNKPVKLTLEDTNKACLVIYNKRQYEHNAFGRFFGATGTNDLGTFGGSSSSFTTTFIPSFYTEYKTVYKTQELDASNIAYTELTHGIEVISPFKMFSKTGDSNLRSILLYPETVEKYPDCVYLLERSPLFGIENPNSIENKMVFFNKGGNIMMFTVSKFYDFTMDTIKTVRIKNSNAHEGITYENLDIPAIKKEYEALKKISGILDTTVFLPGPTFENCYVYKLSPLMLNGGINDVVLYDQNNKRIKTDTNLKIIGASYPQSYFNIKPDTNGVSSSGYKIDSNIKENFNTLKGSSIFFGLYDYSSNEDLSSYIKTLSSNTTQRTFLESFYKLITSDNFLSNAFSKSLFKDLLGNFNISSDKKSPLKLINLKKYLENLVNLVETLFSNYSNNLTFIKDGESVTLETKDFNKLFDRIENDTTYTYIDNELLIPDFEIDSSATYTFDSFENSIRHWADEIRIDRGSKNGKRRSFKSIMNLLYKIFESDLPIDRKDCEELDAILGNNTEPIISIGDYNTLYGSTSSFPSIIDSKFEDIMDVLYEKCVPVPENLVEKLGYNLQKSLRIKTYLLTHKSKIADNKIEIPIPKLKVENDKVKNIISSNNPILTEEFALTHQESVLDVSLLSSLESFIKTILEGVHEDNNSSFIKYVNGDDSVTGNENSLYYKRYSVLNSRMNTIDGPLYRAGMYLKNTKLLNNINNSSYRNINVYKNAFEAIPVADIEPLSYIETQTASETQIELPGKFYSDKEMEALRNQINSSCVLTCTNCKIKDSCPFYDQEEVIKLYCTALKTIDFYVKDNELELLDRDSFNISSKTNGATFNMALFDTMHVPYSDITKKRQDSQNVEYLKLNELNIIRNKLKSQNADSSIDLKYSQYVHDDLGWLLGGRYGSVEKNSIKSLENDTYGTIRDSLHDYKYLYDAVFINVDDLDSNSDSSIPMADNDSYVDYKISSNEYDIDFEVGPPGQKVKFEGKTKIKVPRGLKLFKSANYEDDVYLVSDDKTDKEGLAIVPCIYLGKVGTIKLAFDYTDDGYPLGVTDKNDTRLYAKDIAQWCANYYKGCLAEDPIGYTGDEYKDRDQYWMETVYKRIDGNWCGFPGRRRVASGYVDPLIDTNNFDEAAAISGHPVVNTYVDFVRKVSIQMYDETKDLESERWLVPFVNKNIALPWSDLSFEQNVEIQKKVLTLMKTNLRLVVIKQN